MSGVTPNPAKTSAQMFSLEGENALVTGGATGLGFATAKCFISSGARVVLIGRRTSALEEAVKLLGPAASFVKFDVTAAHEGAVQELLSITRDKLGGEISILVNNAGNYLKKSAVETTSQEFDAVLQTHVVGAQRMTQGVLPEMLKRQHGSIVFMASMASLIGVPYIVAYSAAKAAYLGMMRSLAAEVSPYGVRVNAIAPGWIESPMLSQALAGDDDRRKRILSRTPMGRFGDPEDIGWAAAYLCSAAAGFITGVVLPVDGGASIGF